MPDMALWGGTTRALGRWSRRPDLAARAPAVPQTTTTTSVLHRVARRASLPRRKWRRRCDLAKDVLLSRLHRCYVTSQLLMLGCELIHAMPNGGELEQRRLELLQIRRRHDGRGWRDLVGSDLRKGRGLRR